MNRTYTVPAIVLVAVALAATACVTTGDSDPLARALASSARPDADKARDKYRHPRETLEFLGLAPGQTVVEITPGRGWYSHILAFYLKETGGTYYAAGFDPDSEIEFMRTLAAAFDKDFVAKPEIYGEVKTTVFGSDAGVAPDGSADLVLTFRNVHNWVPRGMAERAFGDFYRALKPGGTLGVVGHRLPASAERPEKLATGYIYESETIALAEAAGFELVASSDVNNNPKDTADHVYGVWTLPPVQRSAPRGEDPNPDFDQTSYKAIGESDRFTLKFRKPL